MSRRAALEAPEVGEGRQSARGDATRAAILDAAERLFAQRGFAGTSMRALADAADTSQPLLHHHFGTKRGLYAAVKDRFLRIRAATWVSRTSSKRCWAT